MLEEDPSERALAKYTRKHLLDMFDALHQKSEFQHISIDDYPERTIPRGVQYKKRPKVDINEDSDASLGESDVQIDDDVDGAAEELSDLEHDGQGNGLLVEDQEDTCDDDD